MVIFDNKERSGKINVRLDIPHGNSYVNVLQMLIADNYVRIWFLFTSSFTLVYLEVISDIQCWTFLSQSFFSTMNTKVIILKTMLAFRVTSNSPVASVYHEDISEIRCNIFCTYWWLISTIQTRKDFQNLCF